MYSIIKQMLIVQLNYKESLATVFLFVQSCRVRPSLIDLYQFITDLHICTEKYTFLDVVLILSGRVLFCSEN